MTELRNKLREGNEELKSIRLELATVKTANELGCPVEELVGRAIPCPTDKLGHIIGKKGRHLQQLSTSAAVQVEVNKSEEKNVVRMVGSLASLDAAVLDLGKIFQQKEEQLDVDVMLLEYLTAKGVTALQDIRASHPDVRLVATREKGIVCRGIAEDIAAFRQDLPVVRSTSLTVTSDEAAMVVGKKGSTIESIVGSHQTAIQVERGEPNTTITVIGPAGHVESAIREIEELLAANREGSMKISIQAPIKNALLLEHGKGIQNLSRDVNSLVGASAGLMTLNFDGDALIVKGKSRVLDKAVEKVFTELRQLEQLMVSIQVDPIVIPVFIGKGGNGIKELKDGKHVTIELDKDKGRIDIAGLDASAIEHVRERVQKTAEGQLVERIQTDPPSAYKSLISGFIRTKAKDVSKLVFLKLDDVSQQIVLRGSRDKLDEAKVLVNQYFAQNYSQEMEVSKDDIQALLTGGKNSKIVELADKTDVKLNTVKERQVIVVRGEKEKVVGAIRLVKAYLYGGEGMSLSKITVDKNAVGVVIGKGGKTKEELEKKYEISIMIHRNENVLTLRGPDAAIEACRAEIMEKIVTARITHTLNATTEQMDSLQKTNAFRRVMQSIPVHVSNTADAVSIRGFRDDVNDAVALLEVSLGKPYRVGYHLDRFLFQRLEEAWKDPSHLQHIEKTACAKLKLTQNTIWFSGTRKEVADAKKQTLKHLEFLFGSQFGQLSVPTHILTSLGKTGIVVDTMARSGCQLILDRDISAILFLCSNQGKLEMAREAIKAKIEEENKRSFVLKLDDSEEWIVSILLGKNGSNIKALRKETKCKIDVRDRIITIHADQEDLIASAKAKVEAIVDKARRECVFVAIPNKLMPAFVGRSGANITKFSEKHGVDVQIMNKGTDTASIRLSGKEEAVSNAYGDIMDWINLRETVNDITEWLDDHGMNSKKDQSSTIIQLEDNHIPRIIGKKGAVVRGLELEFNCRIGIDRETSTVTITGENLDGITEKIQSILQEDREDMKPAGNVDTKKQPESEPQTLETSIPIQEADFPTIGGKDHEPDTIRRGNGITWATVTKPLTGTEYEIFFDDE